jgi:hypothetical protein
MLLRMSLNMEARADNQAAPLHRLRGTMAALFFISSLGMIAELLLTEHAEDFWQKFPLVLLGVGVVALFLTVISNSRILLWLLRLVLVVQIVSSAVGGYFHHKAREEFQLEAYPDLAGWALFKEAFAQRNPPPLAPGAMALIGFLGLGWSYRHPATGKRGSSGAQTITADAKTAELIH